MNNEEKILSMLEMIAIKVDNLEQDMQSVKQEVQSVKSATLRIETEHGSKLGALFDSYSLLYDISKEIRQNIATLITEQEKHELHIKWLNSQHKAK